MIRSFIITAADGRRWGGQTPLSITGTPTWSELTVTCYAPVGHKGSWTYNFPEAPVKIVAVEVKGQVVGYCSGVATVDWRIFANIGGGNILTGRYSKDRISTGGEVVTTYSSGIGLSQSAVDLLQSVASITVTWDMNAGTFGSECWCSGFGYAGVPETVTVYYTPA